MASPPRVSVVVATYKRAERLGALLESLRAQSLPANDFEVVVVDDASPDDTQQVLAGALEGPLRLRCLLHEANAGRAQARQDGWEAADADLIAFTDDDCVVAPDWLEQGLRACAANPGTIVQGRTDPDPAELPELGPFSRTVRVPQFDPAFQTCNIFYPRHVLESVGGFDVEAFGPVHGSEDSDLAWRAIDAGAGAVFSDRPRVFHAVNQLGAWDSIRFAAGWDLLAYARHPQLRRAHFTAGYFWKPTHLWLARALLGALLVGRSPVLRLWLALPWLRSLRARGIVEGGGNRLVPYYAMRDLAEMFAVIRSALRYRSPML